MSQPQIDSQFDPANYNPIITVEDSQEAQEGESGPALATGDPASISAIGDTGGPATDESPTISGDVLDMKTQRIPNLTSAISGHKVDGSFYRWPCDACGKIHICKCCDNADTFVCFDCWDENEEPWGGKIPDPSEDLFDMEDHEGGGGGQAATFDKEEQEGAFRDGSFYTHECDRCSTVQQCKCFDNARTFCCLKCLDVDEEPWGNEEQSGSALVGFSTSNPATSEDPLGKETTPNPKRMKLFHDTRGSSPHLDDNTIESQAM
jgi:hypothetical protein